MVNMEIKEKAKSNLSDLIDRFNKTLKGQSHNNISEETVRTWLNELLSIFGWNVQDTTQILQERILSDEQLSRLESIHSKHKKPDYIMLNGTNIKTFLDAKSLDVNLFKSKETAFQIRSYGWSAQSPCAFVSNFEQLVIYDTRFCPSPEQAADLGTIQISIDEYIDKFDVLFEHLWHDNICANKLEEIYKVKASEGKTRLDDNFTEMLSEFRVTLAKNMVENNPDIIKTDTSLNYYVQVILDRIVFIRVCESKGIEEHEKLKNLCVNKKGFWESFKNSCYMEFYNHYDGAMFSHDDTFQKIKLNDNIFAEFINKLYYPFPYKFDVIPVKVIANIYEEFLSKQLVNHNNTIKEVYKPEYVKTNGAVCTPEHIVDMVCKQAIQLENISNINELLSLKILDPCCGSGVFVVSVYEMLSDRLLQLLSSAKSQEYKDYFYIQDNKYFLTISGRRAIAENCIYGIDCDESAIEVTKMSLALKIVDGNDPLIWGGIGAFGEKILRDIDKNIRIGNTLVGTDNSIPAAQILDIKPLNIKDTFKEVFTQYNGFTYIVGNPPYVETKHYKAAQPTMHNYLSEKYSSFEGKADLAVLFIERCLALLSPKGKIGFVIQRRWFKTDYGKGIRTLINNEKSLEKLIDFKSTDIFKGRITYISIIVLSKTPCNKLSYCFLSESADDVKTLFENDEADNLPFSLLPIDPQCDIWSFDNYELQVIKTRLANFCGTLGDYPCLSIKDGIQALWKKMYHITKYQFDNDTIIGKNGFGEDVKVEKDVVRAVIYNREFYPFKKVEPDAYSIFPYNGSSNNVIKYDELSQKYPLLAKYLTSNRSRIENAVDCADNDEWYRFTREHNHTSYNEDKIIVPMTARDTIATFVSGTGFYMDNANVWFITIQNASADLFKAVSCIINSTIFTVLGKSGANPQSGGYYKFNKQFLKPIPFPCKKIHNGAPEVKTLAEYYDKIYALQEQYILTAANRKPIIAGQLEHLWNELDEICFKLYDVTEQEKQQILNHGRTVSRIELLNGAC